MPYPDPTYVGDCSWIEIASERARIADDVSGRIYTFEGRADQTATFSAGFPQGTAYRGGYITKIVDREIQGPFNQIEVHVALPPNFNVDQSPTNFTTQTAVVSGTVNDSNIYQNLSRFELRREVIYKSPTVSFTYFASGRPGGPRFTGGAAGNIKKISDRITINGYTSDDKLEYTAVVSYSQLPSALREAVRLTTTQDAEISATPILGTPWYRCIDTVSKSYESDSD